MVKTTPSPFALTKPDLPAKIGEALPSVPTPSFYQDNSALDDGQDSLSFDGDQAFDSNQTLGSNQGALTFDDGQDNFARDSATFHDNNPINNPDPSADLVFNRGFGHDNLSAINADRRDADPDDFTKQLISWQIPPQSTAASLQQGKTLLQQKKIFTFTIITLFSMLLVLMAYAANNPPSALPPGTSKSSLIRFDGVTPLPDILPSSSSRLVGLVPPWVVGMAAPPVKINAALQRKAALSDSSPAIPAPGTDAIVVAAIDPATKSNPVATAKIAAPAKPSPVATAKIAAPAEPSPVAAPKIPAPVQPSPVAATKIAAIAAPNPVAAPKIPAPVIKSSKIAALDLAAASSTQPLTTRTPSVSSLIQARWMQPFTMRYDAMRGDAKAQYRTALAYFDRLEDLDSSAAALFWLHRAAEQDFPLAQLHLANFYEKGIHGNPDLATARRWYTAAAENGNRQAMHNLAVLYNEHSDDVDKARYWFNRAARLGVRDSQFNLGIIYQQGFGTLPNSNLALLWFIIAEKHGDTAARKYIDALERQLSEKQRADINKRANAFRIVPPKRSANFLPSRQYSSTPQINAIRLQDPAFVFHVQQLLALYGYDIGTLDGLKGPLTHDAISDFQDQSNLNVNGTISVGLISDLESGLR